MVVAGEIAAARVPVIAEALADCPRSSKRSARPRAMSAGSTPPACGSAFPPIPGRRAPAQAICRQSRRDRARARRDGLAGARLCDDPSRRPRRWVDGEIGSLRSGRARRRAVGRRPARTVVRAVAVWIDGVAQRCARARSSARTVLTPHEGALPKGMSDSEEADRVRLTIKDVAREAGVSIKTVSGCSTRSAMSGATRTKVEAAVEALKFRRASRRVRRRQAQFPDRLIATIEPHYVYEMQRGSAIVARSTGADDRTTL